MDEGESVGGKGEGVAVGVEEEGEAAVLGGDVVDVGGEAEDLEDPVPVAVLVVDPRLAGEERVDHRQKQLRRVERRVGFTGPDREGPRPVQVTCAQELVRRVQPPLRLGSVTAATVHGGPLGV